VETDGAAVEEDFGGEWSGEGRDAQRAAGGAVNLRELVFGKHERRAVEDRAGEAGGITLLLQELVDAAQFLVAMVGGVREVQRPPADAFVAAEELVERDPEKPRAIGRDGIAFRVDAGLAEEQGAEARRVAENLGGDSGGIANGNDVQPAGVRTQADVAASGGNIDRRGGTDARDAGAGVAHVRVFPLDGLNGGAILAGVDDDGERSACRAAA
jgi:hypothetical protein